VTTLRAPSNQEINITGQLKEQQYGWKVSDDEGRSAKVLKTKLKVDRSYQRDLIDTKALAIARDFNWAAFGVLIVFARGDDYYVVDGQHRLAAAMRLASVQQVPCRIFDSKDKADEAAAFLKTNTQRKMMTGVERFRAAVVSGDPDAVMLNHLVTECGRVVRKNSHPNTVSCLSTLLSRLKEDKDTFITLWPMWVEMLQDDPFHGHFVKACWWLERRLQDQGLSLASGWGRERLRKIGLPNCLDSMNRWALAVQSGNPPALGEGLLNALNKGCRKRVEL
jgi:hypothetical protein